MSLDSILERIAVALETIAGNAAPAADKPASKPRAAKPAAAATAAEPANTAAATVGLAIASGATAPAAAPTVTREQIANGVTALINGGKREAVAAILKEHGASNISTIKPEHYASVHAKLTAAV